VLAGERLGVLADLVAQRLGELCEVEDPHLAALGLSSEGRSVADV
jgi:hypothetical protein